MLKRLFNKTITPNEIRMKNALIDIHNQTCVFPNTLETARVTQSCIEDILKEVEDIYLEKDEK